MKTRDFRQQTSNAQPAFARLRAWQAPSFESVREQSSNVGLKGV